MKKLTLISAYSLTLSPEGLHIDGHCGIEEFSREVISVRVKSKLITLRGARLKLAAMDNSELLITGAIQYIELSDRGRQKS